MLASTEKRLVICVPEPPFTNKIIRGHRFEVSRLIKEYKQLCEAAWDLAAVAAPFVYSPPFVLQSRMLIGPDWRGKLPDTDAVSVAAKVAQDAIVSALTDSNDDSSLIFAQQILDAPQHVVSVPCDGGSRVAAQHVVKWKCGSDRLEVGG